MQRWHTNSFKLINIFIGAVPKLRKATISCIMFVLPSVCPHGKTQLPLDGFLLNLTFEYFSKICRGNSSFIKTGQKERVLYMKTNTHFWSYLAQPFLEKKMFQTKVVEKAHTFCSVSFFFRKWCRLWDNVEKYCRADLATDDNMAHAHCLLDS